MCTLLGAILKENSMQPFINNPLNNEKIYIIQDPCHMEKLARNTLASKQIIYDAQGNKIEWRYFESLYQFSTAYDLKTHKLTKKHMDWKRNSMNVALAVETFSESVAITMQFLKNQGVSQFEGCEHTIAFIKRMNTIFDIFNTRNCKDRNIFKRVLSKENKRVIFDFFDETIQYFKSLYVDEDYFIKQKGKKKVKTIKKRVLLLKSRNRTGFRGYIIDMH